MGPHNIYRATPPTLADSESIGADYVDAVGNKKFTMANTLDPVNDGIRVYPEGTYVNLSASALVKTGSGRAQGLIINSNTAGTIKFWDNTAASGTVIINTFSFTTGTSGFFPLFGASFGTGLFATIGGTADVTIIYN
jgi:hypothetical protein